MKEPQSGSIMQNNISANGDPEEGENREKGQDTFENNGATSQIWKNSNLHIQEAQWTQAGQTWRYPYMDRKSGNKS